MQPLLFATPFVIQVFRYGLTIISQTTQRNPFLRLQYQGALLSTLNTEYRIYRLDQGQKWELVPQITGLNKLFLYTECQPLIITDAVNNL
jgi:hypothetical protein